MRSKIVLILVALFISGCTLKAMTPAQREDQVKFLANDIGLFIFLKHKDLIEDADKYADKILEAESSAEVGNLYNMAFQYYLNTHPEDAIFISMGRQLMLLFGVEFSGVDIVPDSIDIGLAKIAVYGFKDGIKGQISH